jgi:hypothetical protein
MRAFRASGGRSMSHSSQFGPRANNESTLIQRDSRKAKVLQMIAASRGDCHCLDDHAATAMATVRSRDWSPAATPILVPEGGRRPGRAGGAGVRRQLLLAGRRRSKSANVSPLPVVAGAMIPCISMGVCAGLQDATAARPKTPADLHVARSAKPLENRAPVPSRTTDSGS